MTDIGAKVAHVLSQKQTRQHACHWDGCQKQVPPAMWGCRKHWRLLPGRLRRKIWGTYRIGQEQDGCPSPEYIEVAKEVREWIRGYLANQRIEEQLQKVLL